MNIGDVQSLSLDTPILLMQLSRWNLSNLNEIFFFTNQYQVIFAGNGYTPIEFKLTGWEMTAESIPQATLSVTDTNGLLTTLINTNRIEGALLRIQRTDFRFCDGQANANTAKVMPASEFTVSYLSSFAPREKIDLVLEPGLYRMRHGHGRRIIPTCSAIFKNAASGCPYTGPLTTCSKRATGTDGCEGRFPGQTLPIKAAGFFGNL